MLDEAARLLRPGGRFAVSDVVADPALDDAERAAMGEGTGCIAGALTEAQYRAHLDAAGFPTSRWPGATGCMHAEAAIIRARKTG